MDSYYKFFEVYNSFLYNSFYLEIRKLSSPNKRQLFIPITKDLQNHLTKIKEEFNNNVDVYFGIIPRTEQKGDKSACINSYSPYLFLDIDIVDIDKTLLFDIKNLLKKVNLIPTFIVFSGRGYHLYFRLKENIKANLFTDAQKQLIRKFNEIAGNLKIDQVIHDIPRIMRLPGTINGKSGKLCEILEFNDVSYDLKDLIKDVKFESKKEKEEKENINVLKPQKQFKNNDIPLKKVVSNYINLRNLKPYSYFYTLSYKNLSLFERKLAEFITPWYTEGNRHYIMLHIAGIYAKLKIPEKRCLNFYENHLKKGDLDNEEDINDRKKVIYSTYKLNFLNPKIKLLSFTLLEALNFDPVSFGLNVRKFRKKIKNKSVVNKKVKKSEDVLKEENKHIVNEKTEKQTIKNTKNTIIKNTFYINSFKKENPYFNKRKCIYISKSVLNNTISFYKRSIFINITGPPIHPPPYKIKIC